MGGALSACLPGRAGSRVCSPSCSWLLSLRRALAIGDSQRLSPQGAVAFGEREEVSALESRRCGERTRDRLSGACVGLRAGLILSFSHGPYALLMPVGCDWLLREYLMDVGPECGPLWVYLYTTHDEYSLANIACMRSLGRCYYYYCECDLRAGLVGVCCTLRES